MATLKGIASFIQQRRLIMSIAVLLAAAGVGAWFTMPTQEDPFFPYRYGVIIAPFPGADPEQIERLVVEPLEQELVQVENVVDVIARIRANVAIVTVELADQVYDTAVEWDEVRRAMNLAKQQFPDGVQEMELRDKQMDASGIVLAVTGTDNSIELLQAARKVKKILYGTPGLSRIKMAGEPGEQITISYDDAEASRLGLSPAYLANQLSNRNKNLPGGAIRLANKTVVIKPNTEFTSLEEIRQTPIRLPSGTDVPLGLFADVRHDQLEPVQEQFWVNGKRAVAVEILAVANSTNSLAFGKAVRSKLEAARAKIAPLEIEEVFFQPDRVEARLSELGKSLLYGIAIVAIVLFLFMGFRMGIVVASIVPLVTFSGLAVYAMGGGVLHQIAIIGLVVALGMMVDNAIVMAENIQSRIDAGVEKSKALADSVRSLATPLGTATGTTLAAFVPMLLAKGNTPDFIRGIPVMIMLTLFISYLFAVFVTPVLAGWLLQKKQQSDKEGLWDKLGSKLGNLAVNKTAAVLLGALMLLIGVAFLAKEVDKQFFPAADRNQLVVDITLPEGTHIGVTQQRVAELESALSIRSEVKSLYSFVGSSGSRFYYNLYTKPRAPHTGRVVVLTESYLQLPAIMSYLREYASDNMPDTEVVPRMLGQGPPVTSPIEVRVLADEASDLAQAVEKIVNELRQIEGTVDVRHDLSIGVPRLNVDVNDAVATRYGMNRQDVAQSLLGRTRGIEIGQYRIGQEPAPVVLRSRAGENVELEKLSSTNIYNNQGQAVPLMQLAEMDISWTPGAIYRRNQQRFATVSSELKDGVPFSVVTNQLAPRLAALDLPVGVQLQFGGEAEGSGEANSALLGAAPLGMIMLLFFLLVEFNSFKRIVIIMVTVPLIAIGVIPGLVITGSPFGFNSMLGIIALVGIVVNNAIVLIDVLDHQLEKGKNLAEAIIESVQQRTRPIILTTVTTIAGLLPLTVVQSTAWPPMAWTIISGLLSSTALTLLVIPALCKWLLSREVKRKQTNIAKGAATVAMVLAITTGVTDNAYADATAFEIPDMHKIDVAVDFTQKSVRYISLVETVQAAAQRPKVRAAVAEAAASKASEKQAWAAGRLPTLTYSQFWAKADEDTFTTFETPSATQVIPLSEKDRNGFSVELRQPIFNLSLQKYQRDATRYAAEATAAAAKRQGEGATAFASAAFLDVLVAEQQIKSFHAQYDVARASYEDAMEQAAQGRATEEQRLSAELAMQQLSFALHDWESKQRIAAVYLQRATGSATAVKPYFNTDLVAGLRLPSLEDGYHLAKSVRADLKAKRLQIKASKSASKAARSKALPTVSALVSYSESEGQSFSPKRDFYAGARVTWELFSAGRDYTETLKNNFQATALEQQYTEALRDLYVELLETDEHYQHAHSQAKLQALALKTAKIKVKTAEARYQQGRSSDTAYKQAKSDVTVAEANVEIAKLQVVRHWLHYNVLLGSTVASALNDFGPGFEVLASQHPPVNVELNNETTQNDQH